jgi:hypothetical protein
VSSSTFVIPFVLTIARPRCSSRARSSTRIKCVSSGSCCTAQVSSRRPERSRSRRQGEKIHWSALKPPSDDPEHHLDYDDASGQKYLEAKGLNNASRLGGFQDPHKRMFARGAAEHHQGRSPLTLLGVGSALFDCRPALCALIG